MLTGHVLRSARIRFLILKMGQRPGLNTPFDWRPGSSPALLASVWFFIWVSAFWFVDQLVVIAVIPLPIVVALGPLLAPRVVRGDSGVAAILMGLAALYVTLFAFAGVRGSLRAIRH